MTLITYDKLKSPIFLLSLLLSTSCSVSNIDIKPSNENIEYLIEQGKALWEQRADSIALTRASHVVGLAYNERPFDLELVSLYSQIQHAIAYFHDIDIAKKDSIFLHASHICKNIVLKHPDFLASYQTGTGDSTIQLLKTISEAPKSLVPILYWWAVNLGHYLNNQPVMERLNHRELMEVIMNRVLALEPTLYYSGPYRFFGMLYTRIPGIDLSQSETYFKQSYLASPEYLGNSVFMAEYYHQKSGNREQFNLLLNTVLSFDLNSQPELISHNFLFQEKARNLLENESSLFE